MEIPCMLGLRVQYCWERRLAPLQTILLLWLCVINDLLPLSEPYSTTRTANTLIRSEFVPDQLALIAIKASITEDPYGSLSSWKSKSSDLLQDSDGDNFYCRWRGVTCSRRHRRRVTKLNLESMHLAGSISPSIGNLTFLRTINLPDNRLSGAIPSEVGRLFRLRYLNLSSNLLDGPIPARLAHCSALTDLELANNRLTGSIPPDLGYLSELLLLSLTANNLTGVIPPSLGNQLSAQLIYLDLSSNRLTGAIPHALGNISSLRVLDVSANGLDGAVPASIWNLSSLEYINLSGNRLTGAIPDTLGNLYSLEELNISANSLSGVIPASMGNLSSLKYLDLFSNQLTGSIPPSLGNLLSLELFDVSRNSLTGGIPQTLGDLTSIVVLAMSKNSLRGVIPPSLTGNLSSIANLELSENRLSGAIPSSLYNLSSLTYFGSVDNSLSGTLPTDIGDTLPNLEFLNIAANKLQGPIPISLSNASRLRGIDLSWNRFSGRVHVDLGRLENLYWLNLAGNRLEAKEAGDWAFITSLSNCSHLKILGLSDNHLGGALPGSIANLSTKLERITMGRNRISGSIPAGIGSLVNLTILAMEENILTGSIPSSVGKLQKLRSLALHGNRFSGQIPSSLGNLSRLIELFLDGNMLQGGIPTSLGLLQNLFALDLSGNYLSGAIPKEVVVGLSSLSSFLDLSNNLLNGSLPVEVGRLRNVGELSLTHNRLSGEIPGTLGACQHLEILNMDGNFLRGVIPPSLSSLKGLQFLDLSGNNLSGKFPEFLLGLHALQYLNLSFNNNLEGEVPKEGVFANASAVSVLGNDKLCGGVAALQLPACPVRAGSSLTKKRARFPTLQVIIPLACGVSSLILVSCLLLIRRSMRNSRKKGGGFHLSDEDDRYEKISYTDLFKATDGFSSTNLIGMGNFGSVYKGAVSNNAAETAIAVKVLNLRQRGASKSFIAECEVLRNIRHRNLLKVITCCSSVDHRGNDFKAIVFEFMPNGSLEKWLHLDADEQNHHRLGKLEITDRLNIAIDVASALDYLHNHCESPIIHCDLKPSNVLFDGDMTAHVGDFGLARFLHKPTSDSTQNPSSSVGIKGSIGYIPPEYGMGGQVSTHGDVYSYGILLLELFTGKSPTDEMFKDGLTLQKFTEMSFSKGVLVNTEIVDPLLIMLGHDEQEDRDGGGLVLRNNLIGSTAVRQCLTSVIWTGLSCSKELPRERMEMRDVVKHMHAVRDAFHSSTARSAGNRR